MSKSTEKQIWFEEKKKILWLIAFRANEVIFIIRFYSHAMCTIRNLALGALSQEFFELAHPGLASKIEKAAHEI